MTQLVVETSQHKSVSSYYKNLAELAANEQKNATPRANVDEHRMLKPKICQELKEDLALR